MEISPKDSLVVSDFQAGRGRNFLLRTDSIGLFHHTIAVRFVWVNYSIFITLKFLIKLFWDSYP